MLLWGLGIAGLSLAVRTAHFFAFKDTPFGKTPIVDAAFYHRWAQEVASGNLLGEGPFFGMPLYPYLLGALYALFGSKIVVAQVLHVVAGSAIPVLVFLLGRRTLGHMAGVTAGLIAALYAPQIFIEGLALSTCIAVALNLVVLHLACSVLPEKGGMWHLLLGLSIGVTALCRIRALLLVPLFMGAALLIRRRELPLESRSLNAAFLLLGALLALLPVTARNLAVTGEPTLVSANGGINFYIGNYRGSNGLLTPPAFLRTGRGEMCTSSLYEAQIRSGRELTAGEASWFWYRAGWKEIAAAPGESLVRTLKKLGFFFWGGEVSETVDFYRAKSDSWVLALPLPDFRIVGPLALLGLFMTLGAWRRLYPLHLHLLTQLLLVGLFFFLGRFRLLAMPVLFVAAGGAVSELVTLSRERRTLALSLACIGCLALGVLVNAERGPRVRGTSVVDIFNHGVTLSHEGRHSEAADVFRRVIQVDPENAKAHHALGACLFFMGDFQSALPLLEQAVRLDPRHANAHVLLGDILLKHLDQPGKALPHYQRAIALHPNKPLPHAKAAEALLRLGREGEAVEEAKKAEDLAAK